jgi:glutamyl-tRNA synthetase
LIPFDSLSPERQTPAGRYAPSPTGDLHLGNMRSALLAWLAARSRGGRFVLRVEDIDLDRIVPDSAQRCLDDLRWLGLDWDGPILWQSERFDLYADRLRQLAAAGLVYACDCSRKDLREASAPHGPDGVVYPGTCRPRTLGPNDLPACRRPGEPPRQLDFAVRLRTPAEALEFEDAFRGRLSHRVEAELGDFVLLRRDGLWSYQFACALDDALSGVTQVVRGEDLLGSTPRQIVVARSLGLEPPREWVHVPLMLDAEGRRLAKRSGATTLRVHREAGAQPEAIRAELAASAGLIPREVKSASLEELLEVFPGWLAQARSEMIERS